MTRPTLKRAARSAAMSSIVTAVFMTALFVLGGCHGSGALVGAGVGAAAGQAAGGNTESTVAGAAAGAAIGATIENNYYRK